MGTPYDAWIAFCQGTLAVGGTFVVSLIVMALLFDDDGDDPEPETIQRKDEKWRD